MKINRPDESEIRLEHAMHYKGMSQKAVASAAGVSSSILSRRLNPEETIVRNNVYDTVMEMHGAVESGQESIGKGVYGMIHREAVALGLVDEQPLDIITLTVEMLRRISTEDIRAMSPEVRNLFQATTIDVEDAVREIQKKVRDVRREQEHHGRPIELGVKRA